MPRAKNLISKRNRNESFTGAQVAAFLEKHGAPEKLAASKRARVVRERGEFDLRRLQSIIRAPLDSSPTGGWTIQEIVAARDQQMAGRFRLPARLAESMGTDDAIFTARSVRLTPVQSLDVEIVPGPKAKGDTIAAEAEALFGRKGIGVAPETITTLRQHITDHGVAIGYNDLVPRADGSRIDFVHRAWPIEWVWWDPVLGCYVTQVRRLDCEVEPTAEHLYGGSVAGGYSIEPIVHGNGRWVVYSKSEILPHRHDAALLPAALVWAAHAYANRDRRKSSAIHGNAKVVGELPPDVALTDERGNMTREAESFLALVKAVASQESPAGIRPAGSKIDILASESNMWQVFSELGKDAEKAAARIYLGSDAVLGAQGGAPGVDVTALFGLHSVKVQSDIACIGRGMQTGVIAPWTAINFGDDRLAPERRYVFPDTDKAEVQKQFGERNAAFLTALKAAKDAGFSLTETYVRNLSEKYDVPMPAMGEVSSNDDGASAETQPAGDVATAPANDVDAAPATETEEPQQASADGPPIYGYHMEYGVVTVNEVRAQLRLPPIEGGDVPVGPPAGGAGAGDATDANGGRQS